MSIQNTKVISESILNTAAVQKNMALHNKRIAIAESVRSKQGRQPLNLETKAALATCLENTRQICETTQSSHIPSKTFFLDMVASVIPNVIAPEIVSVQAMDSKAGMVSYLRFVYGSNKGAVKAGQEFNNSLYKTASDPDYSAAKITDEPVIIDSTDNSINTSFYPVVPGTLRTMDGDVIVPADGSNLATGLIVLPAEITGDDEGNLQISYEYDNETAPVKVPEINLELAQVPIFAKSRKLAAYWGFDAAYDLKKQLTCKVA